TRLASEGLPLVDGKHLLHVETPDSFVAALVRLRQEPELGARLTEAASHVAQEFEWRRIAAQLVELYRAWDSRRRTWLSSTG
ncbi:MAG: glycosyltransferase, partial [Myxococcaceae bacterium]